MHGNQGCADRSQESRGHTFEQSERRKLAFHVSMALQKHRVVPAIAVHRELGADADALHARYGFEFMQDLFLHTYYAFGLFRVRRRNVQPKTLQLHRIGESRIHLGHRAKRPNHQAGTHQ